MSEQTSDERVLNDLTFRLIPHPADAAEVKRRHASNRDAWNEVAVHAYRKDQEERIDFLRNGQSNMHPIEKVNLGELGSWCELAIHLQCASGRDTLSLLNEGVKRVIGVDISDEHIANARATSQALNANALWYACDVLDTPSELDGTADLVYTGRGAMCWLHDLEAWAGVVYRILRPGGVFHVLDDHPASWLFDPDAEKPVYFDIDYFSHCETSKGWPESYVGNFIPIEQQADKYERNWPISSVVNALISAGLQIEQLGEHPEEYYPSMPNLRDEYRGKIPMTFSVKAKRPAQH